MVSQEDQEKFDNLPNTFFTVKLALDGDGDICGECYYDGPALKELNVPKSKAVECTVAAKLLAASAREAIDTAGKMAEIGDLIVNAFKLAEGEHDKDSNSGEVAEQSAGSAS